MTDDRPTDAECDAIREMLYPGAKYVRNGRDETFRLIRAGYAAALARPVAAVAPVAEISTSMAAAAEMLWVVLANVSGGDWTKQTPEWQEAAARWRDNYFIATRAAPPAAPVDKDMCRNAVPGSNRCDLPNVHCAYPKCLPAAPVVEPPAPADAELIARAISYLRYSGMALAADRLASLAEELARVKADLDQWPKWGVIEVAIRNPSVAEFMRHWEGRAESAERQLAAAKVALNLECTFTPPQCGCPRCEAVSAALAELDKEK